MSHFIKQPMREFTNRASLVAGLLHAGFTKEQIEIHEEAVPILNYEGRKLGQQAHVVVRRRHIGTYSNDLGFERLADGSYTMHICDYARDHYGKNAAWLNRVKQGYQVEQAKAAAKRQRQPHQVETRADGSIYIYIGA